jgi:3alpha(or 20beta)-hydroxysteroid dehydrogenase
MEDLSGKVVLVTGAAHGLGAAIADRCVRAGATVLGGDIAFPDDAAGSVQRVELDVTDPQAWSHVADTVRREHGGLNVLVNNAGVLRPAQLAELSGEDMLMTLDVNVVGMMHGIRTFVELHQASGDGDGSIVNISSIRGLLGGHGIGAYSASKFAVRGLTKTAAIELGPSGVRVNAVCPGTFVTDMTQTEQLAHLDWDDYMAQIPLGRFGHPEELAAAVCWLASDASSFVTGSELVVDGGLTAGGIVVRPRRETTSR